MMNSETIARKSHKSLTGFRAVDVKDAMNV